MPTAFTGIRVLSVVLLILAIEWTPERKDYRVFIWSFGMTHYLISLLYSGPQLRALYANRPAWPWFAGMVALGAAGFFGGASLALYFGLHHAINESLMLDRVTRARLDPRVRVVRVAGFVHHSAIFLCLTGTTSIAAFQPAWAWVLLPTGLAYAATLLRARPVLSSREMGDHVVFDVLIMPLVVWSIASGNVMSVIDVALYHFWFWAFFPGLGMVRRGGAGLGPYVALTVALLGAFLLVSPIGFIEPHFGKLHYTVAFFFGSFIHITISFALSDANPAVVNRFFRPLGRA